MRALQLQYRTNMIPEHPGMPISARMTTLSLHPTAMRLAKSHICMDTIQAYAMGTLMQLWGF